GRLRPSRRAADAPRAARLAGERVRRERLEDEETPQTPGDLDCLSAIVADHGGGATCRPGQPLARAHVGAAPGGGGGPRWRAGGQRQPEPEDVRASRTGPRE